MPTAGALISKQPKGSQETLEEREFKELTAVLAIRREHHPTGFQTLQQAVLDRLLWHPAPGDSEDLADSICSAIVECLGNLRSEEITGLIASGASRLVLIDQEMDAKTLMHVATLLQRGGWFASWLALHAERIAGGAPHPTPVEMMAWVLAEMDEFENDIAIAKRTIALYPALFPTHAEDASNAAPGK